MVKIADFNLEAYLSHFTGSGRFHGWSVIFPRHYLTDGAQFLAEKAGAFWLMDIIGSVQHHGKLRAHADRQTWRIIVFDGSRAIPSEMKERGLVPEEATRGALVWASGYRDEPLYHQWVGSTDFPLGLFKEKVTEDGFTLYAGRNEFGGVTIMLPSED